MNNLVIDIIYFLVKSLVADIPPHLGLDFRGAHIEIGYIRTDFGCFYTTVQVCAHCC